MTIQLQTLLDAYRFKDANNVRYFFDIIGVVVDSDGVAMRIPLVSVSQMRNKATSAAVFEKHIKYLESQEKYNAVIINEYDNVSDDASPINSIRVDLPRSLTDGKKSNKKMAKKTKQDLEEEVEMLSQQLVAYKNASNSDALGALSDQLSHIGMGGLGDIINHSAAYLSSQDKLEDMRAMVGELKSDNKSLLGKLESKNEEIERLKEEKRRAEDDLREAKREAASKIENLESKLSIGNIMATGAMGFISKQFKLDEKLAGIFGDDTASSEAMAAVQPKAAGEYDGIAPENVSLIKPCVTYLKSLDYTNLQYMVSVIQYCSQDSNNILTLARFVKQLISKQNDNTGDNQHNS